ncbi:MAG: ABC transporter permease [Planctomycetota bacterium]
MRDENTADGGTIEPRIETEWSDHQAVTVHLYGDWLMGNETPGAEEVVAALDGVETPRRLRFDAGELGRWDSTLLVFLTGLCDVGEERGMEVDESGLPHGLRTLLDLAGCAPEHAGPRPTHESSSFLAVTGRSAVYFARSARELLVFIGRSSLSLLRLIRGRAVMRGSDLTAAIQECGADALPIVSLVSVLVGLIIAFVGALQLRMFGAEIYVASFVGIAIVRELGAILTGVVMAGRTGAAFAAHIGSMQVNQEIDALRTNGISPFDFLVLPRMLALTLMMPLLTLYADLMGLLGGLLVGVLLLDLNPAQYYLQTKSWVGLEDLGIGLFMGVVFGVLVSLTGCMRGMQCGRSAADVGRATTSAVVTAIVSIIVATAAITLLCEVLGI